MSRLAISLVILTFMARGFQQEQVPVVASEREKDVYAIYSLLLTNPQTSYGSDHNDLYLIAGTTVPGTPREPCVTPPREREAEFREVLQDYAKRKDTPRQLTRSLSISKPYVLLTPDEVAAFINAAVAIPRTPDERFRGAADLFRLTDVYFNQKGTLALTAISTFCGGLCGSSRWKVFEKVDGKWEEKRWISCITLAMLHESAFARL